MIDSSSHLLEGKFSKRELKKKKKEKKELRVMTKSNERKRQNLVWYIDKRQLHYHPFLSLPKTNQIFIFFSHFFSLYSLLSIK